MDEVIKGVPVVCYEDVELTAAHIETKKGDSEYYRTLKISLAKAEWGQTGVDTVA